MSGIPTVNLSEERKKELYERLINPKPQTPCKPEDSRGKKYPKMDLTSLVKGSVVAVDQLGETREEFVRLFGVEYSFFKRFFLNRCNSRYFTRGEIVQILIKNNLVRNMEHGLQELNRLLLEGSLGLPILEKIDLRVYHTKKDGEKFRFEYHGSIHHYG